jgi:hypothetical protein
MFPYKVLKRLTGKAALSLQNPSEGAAGIYALKLKADAAVRIPGSFSSSGKGVSLTLFLDAPWLQLPPQTTAWISFSG